MLHPTFSKQRPTRPGFYLIWRKDYQTKPELVEVRMFDKKLYYSGHISNFPLRDLEKNVLFSEAIDLKGE